MRERECEHETKPARCSEKRRRQKKKVAGKKGRRSHRMRGCETIGGKLYSEKRKRTGLKWK